jgi:hypothetical protein
MVGSADYPGQDVGWDGVALEGPYVPPRIDRPVKAALFLCGESICLNRRI